MNAVIAIVIVLAIVVGIGNLVYGNWIVGIFDILLAAIIFGASRSGDDQ